MHSRFERDKIFLLMSYSDNVVDMFLLCKYAFNFRKRKYAIHTINKYNKMRAVII